MKEFRDEVCARARPGSMWRLFGVGVLLPVSLSANAQELLGATVTEATLSILLGLMALSLTIMLVLYRKQRQLAAMLRAESLTDHLTQISNRRHFFQVLCNTITMASRYNQPFCLLVLDLDLFKTINDTYGHTAGDTVLFKVSTTLQAQLRRSDMVGRLGGEEFGVQLPLTPLPAGLVIAERLRQSIEDIELEEFGAGLDISCSIGIAEFHP
ncbi:MAG TPA: GGDEF domain-containing protein, partial [Kineobactrum sp.]